MTAEHRLFALAALLLMGCGADEPERWTRLAEPSAREAGESRTAALDVGDGKARRFVTRGGETRIEVEVARADWSADADGVWHAGLGFQPLAGGGHVLSAEGRTFTLARPGTAPKKLVADSFLVAQGELVLRVAEGSEPPSALFSCLLGRADTNHPHGRRFSGDGFAVWPSAPVERRCDLLPSSVLRFAAALDPLVLGGSATLPPTTLRVELDGVTVFDQSFDPVHANSAWHSVALPAEGRRGAGLRFSTAGSPAHVLVLDPVIGPAERGRLGARPWGESAPDVVVFLADTFRADNLATYGGKLALTPNLDRFAASSMVFARTWSTGTFTLSGHASLFTGLYPHQAGILDDHHALPAKLETLAESFAARGYRTGAITDSGIVSKDFGLDQGFAFFDEEWRTLDETLAAAKAFLDADDGRPTFLFVQTYRVHRRYRVSDETRREHGARLGIEGRSKAIEDELVAFAQANGHPEVERAHEFPHDLMGTPEARAIIARLRAHYYGGVIDLDRGFELFRRDVEARGVLANGYLVFTSDHGEAFGEHGQLYHKDDVYEEQTRIPLLVAGRGITPGVVQHPASLVDLVPTFASLAGWKPSADCQGRSLFALDDERELFSFECCLDRAKATFAALQGGRKVIGLESDEALRTGRIVGAYDLAHDPGERTDAATTETWPRAAFERARPAVERLLVPLVDASEIELGDDKRDELHGLGYF